MQAALTLIGLSLPVQLAYSADVIRSNTAEIVEILTDTVLNPKYNPWEVAEQIFRLKEDVKNFQTNHMGAMQEVICSVCAFQRPAGSLRLVSEVLEGPSDTFWHPSAKCLVSHSHV